MLVDFDKTNKTARLSIDKDYIINDLNDPDKLLPIAENKMLVIIQNMVDLW